MSFRERVEALYRRETGSASAHGAGKWFAEQAGVTDRAVRHWFGGSRAPPGPVLALLKSLEGRR